MATFGVSELLVVMATFGVSKLLVVTLKYYFDKKKSLVETMFAF